MVSFNKVQGFVGYLGTGVVDLNADEIDVYLANVAPSVSADNVKADVTEIATGNGYTGPVDTGNTYSETAGVGTVAVTDVVVTASGGAIATFRYVLAFDNTVSSPVVDPLLGWWDYGSTVDLAAGESFTVDFEDDELATLQ